MFELRKGRWKTEKVLKSETVLNRENMEESKRMPKWWMSNRKIAFSVKEETIKEREEGGIKFVFII